LIGPPALRKSSPERVNALLAMRKAMEKTNRERKLKANAARPLSRPKD
jgi:hypothetical protein